MHIRENVTFLSLHLVDEKAWNNLHYVAKLVPNSSTYQLAMRENHYSWLVLRATASGRLLSSKCHKIYSYYQLCKRTCLYEDSGELYLRLYQLPLRF